MMAAVEVVLTDTRLWALGPARHWDAAPSVVLGSNGFDLVVGEPVTPPTQVSSVVQFISAQRLALPPRLPSMVDAMTAVLGAVLANLYVETPCERLTIVCPTEWGGRRRGVVETAARSFASNVVFEDVATRAVASDAGADRSRRTVVLECGPLSTTATAVVRSHRGIHIESCEYQPHLASLELAPDTAAFGDLCALVNQLLGGHPVDLVQVIGVADPATLDVIRAAVEHGRGQPVEVRPVAGADLLRRQRQQPEYQYAAPPAMPTAEWMQPLRQRAVAAQAPERRRVATMVAGAAATVVVIAAAIGAVVVFGGSEETSAVAATGTSTEPAPSAIEGTTPTDPKVAPTTVAPAEQEIFDRIEFQVPAGWRLVSGPGQETSRITLVPENDRRERLTVTQTRVAPGVGAAAVAADLEAQMTQRQDSGIADLRRDVEFGGKTVLTYTERPGDGSTVRWHVLVDQGVQVSIGCQYVGDAWAPLVATCAEFTESVAVLP